MNVYLYKNDEQYGPYSVEQVQALVQDGSYTPLDSAWFEGCQEWTTISHVPGILILEEKRPQQALPPFEAYTGDQPYVFISYAHKDSGVVYEEIQRLHEAGYRIWYDEGIEVSNEWPEEIAHAVIGCALFLVFVSPRATASVNCRNEINMALNKDKAFLAIYLEETELPPGLELRMGDLQAILKFRMHEAIYRKKVFAGLEKLLGRGGRQAPQGRDPVAEAMAVQAEADYLAAPVAADGVKPNSLKNGLQLLKAQGKRTWITAGVIFVLCLAWLFSPEEGDADSNLIAVPRGKQPPAGYSLFQRGETKPFQWQELAPVSVARYAYDGVDALGGEMYFVGGLSESGSHDLAERFDPAANRWKTLSPMSVARRGVATAALNGKLYAIGGVGLTSVEIYDPQTNKWSAGPELPSEVKFSTAITVDRKILLIGGLNSGNQSLDQVLELKPAVRQWRSRSPMPTERNSVKLVFREGKVWAIGGYDTSYSAKVEIYDVATDSWTKGPSLGTPRDWPTSWLANGRIFVAGGQQVSSTSLSSIEAYDPATNQWSAAGFLPESMGAADAVVIDHKVYLVGGSRPSGEYSAKVFAADLTPPKDLYIRDDVVK